MYSHDTIEAAPDNSIPCPSAGDCQYNEFDSEFAAWERASDEALINFDPDEGLEIRKSVRDRLLRQKKAVAAGERGVPLAELAEDLSLQDDE